ncbi:uncharacterized protein BDR25DRAFT_233834 [Lindgomyces ingoldianus]|uniref:Uncharacterized protein n=1 Tax=Lindgomyces ingoldianus TaxID=673940 RepID=A0ACB6QLD5_9PLEO|nr:uncharacterized protein BDR25DRAFT_233834 [Lindgomyces ingoldianus]KAF2467700.1 hypothetical protein BDR25DRAFT_233834 [Lindgomyces ingoldianus]
MLPVILGALALLASPTTAQCDVAILQQTAVDYLTTATTGQNKLSLADSMTYTENAKSANTKSGMLSKALKISHNRTLLDTTQCATYTELIAPDNTPPYVIGTQIRLDTASGKVNKLESIITTTGDWFFDAKSTLSYSLKENRDPIPEAKRDTRAVIKAAADAYLDLFNNKSVKVPWGNPCERVEGGHYFGPDCNVGVPSGVQLVNRRYVCDETVGTCDVMLAFGGASGMPDSHEFRIEGGKIRLVHTITAGKM